MKRNRKEYLKKYNLTNKEKLSARRRRHYVENKDKILIQTKEWHEKNKDKTVLYKEKYYGSLKGKFRIYKTTAKQRGLIFNISFELFSTFWQKDCSYCGTNITTIGLDRIDSEKGYVEGNIVSCCAFCNTMKLNHPVEEFVEQCRKVIKHNDKL